MRILVDTNILLDYILDREPYGEAARCVVKACKDGTIKGCIAAHSISNMFFILRKVYAPEERRILFEYYGAAEPPVRCGESHLSGLTEPPHFVY